MRELPDPLRDHDGHTSATEERVRPEEDPPSVALRLPFSCFLLYKNPHDAAPRLPFGGFLLDPFRIATKLRKLLPMTFSRDFCPARPSERLAAVATTDRSVGCWRNGRTRLITMLL